MSLGGTAAGTVVNFGTIASVAAGRAGVFLNAGGTVSNFGTIAGGPGAAAIYTRGGASVSNALAAVITGIEITRGAGTVDNLGSIAGVGLTDGGVVINGQSGATAGLITGSYIAVQISNGAATVVNYGLIAVPAVGSSGYSVGVVRLDSLGTVDNFGTIAGTAKAGVYLGAGGDVTNGRSGSSAGLIAGSDGVVISRSAGAVTNYGTITGTAAGYSNGIILGAGGLVTNFGTILGTAAGNSFGVASDGGGGVNGASGATAGLILGAYAGVSLGGTAAGTVVNFGTIASVYPGRLGVFLRTGGTVANYGTIAGGPGGDGIYTQAGASVSNKQGAVITGVVITRGAGTVDNLGSIAGVGLTEGGKIVNGQSGSTVGLITGSNNAIEISGSAGTVVNFGTLAGAGNNSGVVRLVAGGTVTNYGTIVGGPGIGVWMDVGGTVINGRKGSSGGVIAGARGMVLGFSGGVSTVTNFGTIVGTGTGYSDGVDLDAGGLVTNFGTILGTAGGNSVGAGIGGGGTLVNGASGATAALILGSYAGVSLGGTAAGTVVNFGTIASVATARAGVLLGAGGTVSNYGMIAGGPGGVGMYLRNGGDVTNQLSGVIIGAGSGIAIARAAGTVVNYGTIIATGSDASAVDIRYGAFVNHGLVEGAAFGIVLGGTIATFGTIGSTGTTTFASGMVTVSGTVSGAVGISTAPGITAGYTLTVGGTVMSTAGTAGTAVKLGSGNNRVILAPGATFQGVVDGGVGGQNVLEFDAGAYFLVPPDKFKDFQTLKLDSQVTLAVEAGKIKFDALINEGKLKAAKGDSFAFGKVSAASIGIVELSSSGTVTFSGSVVHQTLDFVTVGGTAVIDDPKEFFGTITGFTAGDRIVVAPIVVSSGQTSGGITLQIGFTETVLSGGTASGTTVLAGGTETVFGNDIGTQLRGGAQTVSSGGTASATGVAKGGVERVYGRASGGTVSSGGRQIVESGGVASGATVKAGADQYVYSGGTARGTVLS
ncbi:MAG: hypothetical protein WA459_05200, partial [Stellaceae bacterium]